MNVRAKFRCDAKSETMYGYTGYKFSAVYDTSTPENRRYATATPSGELTINVTNPDVFFKPGAFYYLDFTPELAEAPATA